MIVFSYLLQITKYFLYSFFVVFMLLLLLLGIGLFTHTGNTLIFESLHKYEPRLTIRLDDGSVLNSPKYKKIKWSDGEALYEFNDVSYDFNWYCLINELCLDSLEIGRTRINIVLPSSSPVSDKDDSEPFRLNFPLPVHIKHLNVSDTNVKVAGVEIDVENILLQASGVDNDITLDAVVSGLTVVLPDSQNQRASNNIEQKHLKNKDIPAILNDASLPEVVLPFNGIAKKLNVNGFKLVQNNNNIIVVNKAESKFTYIGSKIEVEKLEFDLPEFDADISGNIALTAKYPMDVKAKLALKDSDLLQPSDILRGQRIKLSAIGDLSNLSSRLVLSNLINAEINNNIDLYSPNLPHKLSVNWSNVSWPLKGKSSYSASNGSFSSRGTLSEYTVSLSTNYHLDQLPEGKVQLKGIGNLSSLTLTPSVISTLQGQLKLDGELSWTNNIRWDGNLNVNKINFNEMAKPYPLQLNGQLKHSATVAMNDSGIPAWSFTLPIIKLDGKLFERPLSLNGSASGNSDDGFSINAVNIKNADNSVIVNGTMAEHNDLLIKVAVNDLSKIVFDAKGAINGDINLAGSLDKMVIKTKLSANKLAYLEDSIDTAELSGDVTLDSLPLVNLNLDINDAVTRKQKIKAVSISINHQKTENVTTEHNINFDLVSDIANTHLQSLFTQKNNLWNLTLNKGFVNTLQGTWSLNKSFITSVKNQTVKVTPHCWYSTSEHNISNGKVCIKHFSAGDNGNISMQLDDFQINTLSPFFPDSLAVEGGLDASLNLTWLKNRKPNIDFAANGDAIVVNIQSDNIEQGYIRYPVEALKLSLKTKKEQANFSLKASSTNLLDFNLNGALTPYKNSPEVSATLDLLIPDFNAFSRLLPDIDKLDGQLQSDITISGKLKKPNIKGSILIADGAIEALAAPVQISDLNAQIDIDNNKANLKGFFLTNPTKDPVQKDKTLLNELVSIKDEAISRVNIAQRIAEQQSKGATFKESNGRADITGSLDWSNKLKGKVQFEANQMYVQDYGKVELYLSPKITLIYDKYIQLQGVIKVDKGNITVKALPEGAVNVSKDIIVVDAEKSNDVSDLPVNINLAVQLGNALRVKAIGLDSYVHGDLRVRKALKKALTMNGELTFSQGSYRALAQQLVIQNSRVVFQGQPESPYLFIEAIRDPNKIDDNVTAGVRVIGTPEQLQLTLFSDPSMSQQDILSYVTTGQSIENSSEDGASSHLTAVLIGISAGKTDGVMQEIGGKIGISDLSLASSGHGDEQSVGVRGTLAPGVEISYGVGVFDSFTILALRYELFKKFYIEASSGLYNAVDAYYEWDWD